MAIVTKSILATAPAAAVLIATDAKRAWAFYHDTLGLETEWVQDLPGNFMVHAGDGTAFMVYEGTAKAGENTVLSFRVDDLELAVADLRGHGVRFEEYDMPGLKTVDGIVTMGSSKSAWFRDTEGNTISVAQM
jgi:catechol 2,3-dioxygenase-like lactoylglutathione lyase family enzyme